LAWFKKMTKLLKDLPAVREQTANVFLILLLSHSRLNNTQNEVASEEMPVSLIDAEKMLKELEDLKVCM